MWFGLKGDERLKQCASEGCGGQPTWRLEAGGVGSDYCSGCKDKITDLANAGGQRVKALASIASSLFGKI